MGRAQREGPGRMNPGEVAGGERGAAVDRDGVGVCGQAPGEADAGGAPGRREQQARGEPRRARAPLHLSGLAVCPGRQEPRLLPARREAPGDEAPIVYAREVHHRRDLAEREIVAQGGVGLAQERAAHGELPPTKRAAC